jgi:hypothetical protein
MVLPHERNPIPFGAWHSAATLASAIVVLGLVMAWPAQQAEALAPAGAAPAATAPCTAGDDVSNFVCRNGWFASLAHNYR